MENIMAVRSLRVDPPSEDKRWLIVNATMRQQGYEAHALIEALHTVQESFGFIDNDALKFVSSSLNVPLSKALGVATFYHFFSLKPRGEHSCVVCTGTACYIKGSGEILDAITASYGIKDGETTGDDKLSLMTARCLGACGLAPAVVIDNEVMPKLGAETVVEKLKGLIENGA
jgi:bidirectional [NiFe] hydrogenase diaphorase subunit